MYEQKSSHVPFIQSLWRATVVQAGEYDDPAKDTWGLAFTKHSDGTYAAELLGQSFQYSVLNSIQGDSYWGVEFYPYTTMRGVNKPAITGKLVPLPVSDNYFSIGNDTYQIPNAESLEKFCISLAAQGIISHVARLSPHTTGLSLRSRQRHYRQTVGLTHKQIQQIKRAEHAVALLKDNIPLADAAIEAGYADQAHMARSLKALLGKSPANIKRST